MSHSLHRADNGALAVESLAQAYDELTSRLQAGEALDAEEVRRRYPQHAAELLRLLPALAALDELSVGQEPAPGHAEPLIPPVLGDFRLLREVGRGGMGIVYEAEQVSLGRRVALKVLPLAGTLDQRHLQRFKNEARAAAQLHHTNIVPVYFVGSDHGVHYYAMEFIDGHSLAEIIDQLRQERGSRSRDLEETAAYAPAPPERPQNGTPISTQVTRAERAGQAETVSATPGSGLSRPAYFAWVARLGEQAALALEHAHQQGVLHRDIKPANLLLDIRGNVWVTDFGLAHLPGDQRLTMTGDLLGTLRYMSPEQALAQRVAIDHRTDIYSLGATLYELLTLRPAYAGQDRQELLSQIAFKEPRPLRKLDKSIPAELETIVLKAMEKAPGDRYSSARELAEDLRRHLADEPIRARRPGVVQRMRKWGRRHKPVLATAVVLLILAVIGQAIGSVLLWQEKDQTKREKEQTKQEKERADQQRSQAENNLAFSYQILDGIYMDVAVNLGHQPILTPKDKQFLERMRTLYEKVAAQGGDTPATRLKTARAFRRIGEIQNWLGQPKETLEAFDSAVRMLAEPALAQTFPRDGQAELAAVHLSKGSYLTDHYEWSAGVRELQMATGLFQALAAAEPSDDAAALGWAESEVRLAHALVFCNGPGNDQGIGMLRHAEKLLQKQCATPGEHAQAQHCLGCCERDLACYLSKPFETKEAWRRAIEAFAALHASAPGQLDYLLDLEDCRVRLASLLATEPTEKAAAQANRKALNELNGVVISQLEKHAKNWPTVPSYRNQLCMRHSNFGLLLANEGNWDEAERQYRLGLEAARKLEANFPKSPNVGAYRAVLMNNLACVFLESPKHRDPTKGLACAQEAVRQHPSESTFQGTLGEAYYRAGQYRAAITPLLLALRCPGCVAECSFVLAMVHWQLGEKSTARCWWRFAEERVQVHKCRGSELLAWREEATRLLGISPGSKPRDEDAFQHDLEHMCHKAPMELPRRIDSSTPLDRFEALFYVEHLNYLAWECATSSDASLREPGRAVRLAQALIAAVPQQGNYWNTLGVAQYRTGSWQQAIVCLQKSVALRAGGDSFDWFFLAMCHWQLGQRERARDGYARAVNWMAKHKPQDAELSRFRSEAAKLLGMPTG